MRLGNANLYLASDGRYWEDGAGHFGLLPRVEWQQLLAPDDRNRVPLEARCLVIETGTRRYLVDTGFGSKMSDKERRHISLENEGRLHDSLALLGLGPDDMDAVINTHLHSDHCGGNTCYDLDGALVATFPRAQYYIQRLELADAMYPNERTRSVYLRENFQPLETSGQLCLLWGDTRLDDEVRVIITPGHTAAHQSVVIESQGQTALFLGDVANWPLHMEQIGCVTAFDVQPMVNIETKRRLARWAVENEVLLIFDHHPDVKAGYLRPAGPAGQYHLQPVEL